MNTNTTLDIAIGSSRKSAQWTNTRTTWGDFVKRISATTRTPETYAEYTAMPKARQDDIKDVGGFVGGYIDGGRRKLENIRHRQLVTLDIDFGTPHIWQHYTATYTAAAALYSTHKHTPQTPRYRLLIPLNRPVSATDYEAVSRHIATTLGIQYFDQSTFEPSRLMYWPSTSADAEFVFEQQQGDFMDADEVLKTLAEQSMQASELFSEENNVDKNNIEIDEKQVQTEAAKQRNPRERQGIVGAFCRTYTIGNVISKYLAHVYTPTRQTDRYTYIGGTTSGGLVVFADTLAYSFHSTDPACGKLHNAFDLVRAHLFGSLDTAAKPATPYNRMPSYTAMLRHIAADASVKKQLLAERTNTDSSSVSADWLLDLEVDTKNEIKGTISNYELILRNDAALSGAFEYNEFDNTLQVRRPLPWRKNADDLTTWRDADDAGLRAYIEKTYRTLSKANLLDALTNVFEENRTHPVRAYLQAAVWDETPRVERLFIDYLGAANTPYTRAVTRKTLAAAVARIFQPGIKFDNVLVLIGKQGIVKAPLSAS